MNIGSICAMTSAGRTTTQKLSVVREYIRKKIQTVAVRKYIHSEYPELQLPYTVAKLEE
jgi:hypothetical protein